MNPRMALLPLALLPFLSGCSSTPADPKAKELPSSEKVNIDASQANLFDAAQGLFQRELYSVAKESYESLRNGYPLGPYSEYSEVKYADAHFATGDYAAAGVLYENFVKDHPASAAVPYALFMAARSYHLSNKGVGRDPAPLDKARAGYEQLLIRYPNSVYAESAAQHKREVLEQLALYQLMVLEFYKNQDKEEAFRNRSKEFSESWEAYLSPPAAPEGPDGQPAAAPDESPSRLSPLRLSFPRSALRPPPPLSKTEQKPLTQPRGLPPVSWLFLKMQPHRPHLSMWNANECPTRSSR
jgi:outer membrane protein assembly factor BamD